ncbi:hypothetical protein BDW02DRAFT_565573 [Decorospora gaudefroyi]|uniref:KANL3/Tex30 alpha/beta hydrolase-like domain-containing protein n=1 Tax=Decorospora gaudefroyi TaxID=184978 RepID=A0A6A5KQB5_9PLEO|nr:hypothetical protein BDW02DRAFT_565573 [Decorospora gaudefroyi]
MAAKRRRVSEPASAPAPKRVTRSSKNSNSNTTTAQNKPNESSKAPSRNHAKPTQEQHTPSNGSSPTDTPPTVTTRTITHALVKNPIQCHQYTSTPTPSGPPPPTMIFTHGAGGTLAAPAVANFCTGFSTYTPILAFQGSMNLKARTKNLHACIDALHPSPYETKQPSTSLLLGGRSMGARAAIIAAANVEMGDAGAGAGGRSVSLVLVPYPLKGPKGDVRDGMLMELDGRVDVLFVVW